MSKTYNGWTNYETWNVNLWIDNDGSQVYWDEIADDLLKRFGNPDRNEAVYRLSKQLEYEIKEQAPDLGVSCYADILNAALSEVNWHEIASAMIENAVNRISD